MKNNKTLLGALVLFILYSCNNRYQPTQFQSKLIEINQTIQSNHTIDSIIAPYKVKIEQEINQVIGESSYLITKGKPESLMLNFAADLMLNEIDSIQQLAQLKKVDFAFVNDGGLRTTLPQGAIRVRDIYKVMPFENKISILGLKGSTVKQWLDKIAKEKGEGVSGITFQIKNNKAVNVKVQGEAFDINKTYYMVTSDYLANGGGGDMLLEAIYRYDSNYLYRDMIIKHIEKLTAAGKQVAPKLDQRIVIIN